KCLEDDEGSVEKSHLRMGVVYENKEGLCCASRRLIGPQAGSSTGLNQNIAVVPTSVQPEAEMEASRIAVRQTRRRSAGRFGGGGGLAPVPSGRVGHRYRKWL